MRPVRLLLPCVQQHCGEFPSWLRHLAQRFFQFGKSVDFRQYTLQRVHRGCDMLEEMVVTLDQAQKSVSA
jgi:hypothetical protein